MPSDRDWMPPEMPPKKKLKGEDGEAIVESLAPVVKVREMLPRRCELGTEASSKLRKSLCFGWQLVARVEEQEGDEELCRSSVVRTLV